MGRTNRETLPWDHPEVLSSKKNVSWTNMFTQLRYLLCRNGFHDAHRRTGDEPGNNLSISVFLAFAGIISWLRRIENR